MQTSTTQSAAGVKSLPAKKLFFVVDLDERGSFRGHIEDEQGADVFSFTNEDESGWPSEDGFWLVECGYMKHTRDLDGLLDYLIQMGFAGKGSSLQKAD